MSLCERFPTCIRVPRTDSVNSVRVSVRSSATQTAVANSPANYPRWRAVNKSTELLSWCHSVKLRILWAAGDQDLGGVASLPAKIEPVIVVDDLLSLAEYLSKPIFPHKSDAMTVARETSAQLLNSRVVW